MQHQLYDVQQIVGSAAAFAALRGDGLVVAWGDVTLGGDVAEAQQRLQGRWGKHGECMGKRSWRWLGTRCTRTCQHFRGIEHENGGGKMLLSELFVFLCKAFSGPAGLLNLIKHPSYMGSQWQSQYL